MTVQQRTPARQTGRGESTAPSLGVHAGNTGRLMTIVEVAEMLSIPLETLYSWRSRGIGPVGYRVGRHVRYRQSAVESWLEARADQRD